MSLNRRNPRRDANEPAIVDTLRVHGYDVDRVSGAGLPDVLVRRRGSPAGLCVGGEIKTAHGRLTKAQGTWPIWRTPEDAITDVSVLRNR